MEAVGLAAGLVPLFSVCLEYFQYFKTAKSLSIDYQLLLLKFDFEHERFIIWGERHGINRSPEDGRNPQLDDPESLDRISRALELLKALFEAKESLESKYGVIATPPNGSPTISEIQGKFMSSAALRRFWGFRSPGATHRTLSKTHWAIHDKDKFSTLVRDVRDLITGLYDVLPILPKERDRLVAQDIRSLLPDVRRLRQVEVASEEAYPAWSEAASMVITMSEMGSVDDAAQFDGNAEAQKTSLQPLKVSMDTSKLAAALRKERFFVFTAECLSNSLGLACDISPTRSSFLDNSSPSFASTHPNVKWSIGKRIASTFSGRLKTAAEKALENSSNEEQSIRSYTQLLVRVYCAPCACAIRTALLLCHSENSKLLIFEVLVDDRIPSACCPRGSSKGRLESLLEIGQLWEAGQLEAEDTASLLQHINMVWVEERIYELETRETTVPEDESTYIRDTMSLLSNTFDASSVYIGELDELKTALSQLTPPYPVLPRQPRLNEIYKMGKSGLKDPWTSRFLGTFTAST